MVDAVPPGVRQQSPNNNSNGSGGLMYRVAVLISVVLRMLMWPLRRLSFVLFPPKEYDGITQSADAAARAFAASFRSSYRNNDNNNNNNNNNNDNNNNDDVVLPFEEVGFAKTLARARRENRVVLVCLHSPLHPDSDGFCRRVLRDPRVVAALRESDARLWGGSIHAADGAHAARSLRVDSYPYAALLAGRVGDRDRVDVLWRTPPGETDPGRVAASLNVARRIHANVVAEAENRRLTREREAELRREQDREYRETLDADRRREAERKAAAEAERVEREREAERAEEEARVRRTRIEEARALAGEEPPPGTPGTARIRVTLPTGERVDRRFAATDEIRKVRAFLTVHLRDSNSAIENFELSSNYPKRTWTDHDVTLEEAGLCPQAVLMLQDLDA